MEKKLKVFVRIAGIISIFLGLYYSFKIYERFNMIQNVFQIPFILFIPAGIGMLFFRDWARKLTIIVSKYNVIIAVISAIIVIIISSTPELASPSNLGTFLFTSGLILYLSCGKAFPVIPPILFLYFLTRPKVKEQFR